MAESLNAWRKRQDKLWAAAHVVAARAYDDLGRAEKRKRRQRWKIVSDRVQARRALTLACDTLAHADGDESLAYRCEATVNPKLASAVDSCDAYGPPLTPKQHHAVIASALLDGIYVGDLP